MSPARKSSAPAAPSALELQILSVLWRRGHSTAREVLEALPDGKVRAYTSVLSVMQVMQKKRLLDVGERRGLAHVYRPLVSRRQVLGPVMRGMIKKVFSGSPSAAVEHLLDAAAVSEEELDAIVHLVNNAAAARKEKRGGK
jgi:BlaI family transcriptional regulator, penicillinase repressor